MEVDVELKIPRAAVRAGKYRLLRTLVTSGALGLVESVLPRVLGGLPTRKYTLDAHMTFQYDEDETVTVPAGTELLALPNPAPGLPNPVSALTASCKRTAPTALSCHRSFQLKSRFINPARYAELRARSPRSAASPASRSSSAGEGASSHARTRDPSRCGARPGGVWPRCRRSGPASHRHARDKARRGARTELSRRAAGRAGPERPV